MGLINQNNRVTFLQIMILTTWLNFRSRQIIANFQVIDLLNPGAKRLNLAVRWNKRSRAFVVDNLFSIECGELDDLLAVLEVT